MKTDYQVRLNDEDSEVLDIVEEAVSRLWTALPGVVTRFDKNKLIVDVQPTIQGRITNEDGEVHHVDLPILLDVPVVFPHAGGVSMTFPVASGDECLVVFASRCIDGWWQNGGVQPPFSSRKHDLSDGFAILGAWSQKTRIGSVSGECFELRSDDRQTFFSINPKNHDVKLVTSSNADVQVAGNATVNVGQKADITCPSITFNASEMVKFNTPLLDVSGLIKGGGGLSISGGSGASVDGSLTTTGDVTAAGISLDSHVHTGVQGGPDKTGGPQ